jgi:hypothetical protein
MDAMAKHLRTFMHRGGSSAALPPIVILEEVGSTKAQPIIAPWTEPCLPATSYNLGWKALPNGHTHVSQACESPANGVRTARIAI